MFFRKIQVASIIFQIIACPKRIQSLKKWFLILSGTVEKSKLRHQCQSAISHLFQEKKRENWSTKCPVYVLWKMVLPTNFRPNSGCWNLQISMNHREISKPVLVQEHLEHYWKTYFHHHFDPKSFRRWFSPRGSNLLGLFERFNRVPLVRCAYLFVKSSWYCMLILRI